MMSEQILQVVVFFVTLFMMTIGLFFALMPPLPGTVIIWAAAAFYGLMVGWDESLGWLTFGLLTFFMIVGVLTDFVAGNFGARMGGASWWAVAVGAILGFILGIVASLIGTPVLGCLAGLIGMVGGVLWVEWRRNKDWQTAVRATKGYAAGTAAGIMAKVTSGAIMVGIFLVRVYFGS